MEKNKTEQSSHLTPTLSVQRGREGGFTLAEVLITLGIIGVVAALTIPTLVANYQAKSWSTVANVFEKRLTEAVKTMNVQGKLGSYGGYSTTEGFVEELQKHFKIAKVCDNDHLMECFEDKITMNNEEVDMTDVFKAKHFGHEDWNTNIVGIQVANGTNALIAYNPKCKANPYDNDITGSDCYAIVYDTSGFSEPNELGKDLRKNTTVVNIAGRSCAFKLNGICFGQPFKPVAITSTQCQKEKDNLGIKNCGGYSNETWAGAVKTCGGIDNMPTLEDLALIASDIYGKTISADASVSGNWDENKMSKYGFDISAGYVVVWSSVENSSVIAVDRRFYPNRTGNNTDSRAWGWAEVMAICKVRE